MEKGQICYVIISNDIEPAEFIEEDSKHNVCVKRLNIGKFIIQTVVIFAILKRKLAQNCLIG